MAQLNLDALVPWDLTVTLSDKSMVILRPTWAAVLAIGKVQAQIKLMDQMQDDGRSAVLCDLRTALGGVTPEEYKQVTQGADFCDLVSLLTVVSAYYADWVKKKQMASLEAIGLLPKPEPAAPPKPTTLSSTAPRRS